jgi:hypothetical protein
MAQTPELSRDVREFDPVGKGRPPYRGKLDSVGKSPLV